MVFNLNGVNLKKIVLKFLPFIFIFGLIFQLFVKNIEIFNDSKVDYQNNTVQNNTNEKINVDEYTYIFGNEDYISFKCTSDETHLGSKIKSTYSGLSDEDGQSGPFTIFQSDFWSEVGGDSPNNDYLYYDYSDYSGNADKRFYHAFVITKEMVRSSEYNKIGPGNVDKLNNRNFSFGDIVDGDNEPEYTIGVHKSKYSDGSSDDSDEEIQIDQSIPYNPMPFESGRATNVRYDSVTIQFEIYIGSESNKSLTSLTLSGSGIDNISLPIPTYDETNCGAKLIEYDIDGLDYLHTYSDWEVNWTSKDGKSGKLPIKEFTTKYPDSYVDETFGFSEDSTENLMSFHLNFDANDGYELDKEKMEIYYKNVNVENDVEREMKTSGHNLFHTQDGKVNQYLQPKEWNELTYEFQAETLQFSSQGLYQMYFYPEGKDFYDNIDDENIKQHFVVTSDSMIFEAKGLPSINQEASRYEALTVATNDEYASVKFYFTIVNSGLFEPDELKMRYSEDGNNYTNVSLTYNGEGGTDEYIYQADGLAINHTYNDMQVDLMNDDNWVTLEYPVTTNKAQNSFVPGTFVVNGTPSNQNTSFEFQIYSGGNFEELSKEDIEIRITSNGESYAEGTIIPENYYSLTQLTGSDSNKAQVKVDILDDNNFLDGNTIYQVHLKIVFLDDVEPENIGSFTTKIMLNPIDYSTFDVTYTGYTSFTFTMNVIKGDDYDDVDIDEFRFRIREENTSYNDISSFVTLNYNETAGQITGEVTNLLDGAIYDKFEITYKNYDATEVLGSYGSSIETLIFDPIIDLDTVNVEYVSQNSGQISFELIDNPQYDVDFTEIYLLADETKDLDLNQNLSDDEINNTEVYQNEQNINCEFNNDKYYITLDGLSKNYIYYNFTISPDGRNVHAIEIPNVQIITTGNESGFANPTENSAFSKSATAQNITMNSFDIVVVMKNDGPKGSIEDSFNEFDDTNELKQEIDYSDLNLTSDAGIYEGNEKLDSIEATFQSGVYLGTTTDIETSLAVNYYEFTFHLQNLKSNKRYDNISIVLNTNTRSSLYDLGLESIKTDVNKFLRIVIIVSISLFFLILLIIIGVIVYYKKLRLVKSGRDYW